jgi:hypothetical protein
MKQGRQTQCTNCHRYLDARTTPQFCGAECAHEWSAKIYEAQTPLEVWRIVELARSLLTPDAAHRAVVYGKLLQACRATWPTTAAGDQQR